MKLPQGWVQDVESRTQAREEEVEVRVSVYSLGKSTALRRCAARRSSRVARLIAIRAALNHLKISPECRTFTPTMYQVDRPDARARRRGLPRRRADR